MDIKLFLESVFSSKLRKIIKYLKENTVIDLTDILKEMPWDKIKKYINPNVTKLIVPFGVSVRRDMSFFNNFSHLESIDFKNGFIQNDDLDILSQGSVKQIEAEDGLIDISKSENAASISYNDKSKFYYNGVLISLNGHNRFGSRDTINVEMSNFDKDILKLLLEDVNTLEFNKIILCGINPSTSLIHNIEYSGKVIKDIQSSTRNDGQDLLDFYKLLIDNGYTFENVQMAITNLDFEINSKEFLKEALSLFEKTNVSRLSVKSIETTKNDPSLILKNNVLENLIIPISKKSDLEEFYNFLENKGLKVSELTLRLDMYDKYSDDV